MYTVWGLGTTMSPWAADLIADRPGTKNWTVGKISRGQTMQAFKQSYGVCVWCMLHIMHSAHIATQCMMQQCMMYTTMHDVNNLQHMIHTISQCMMHTMHNKIIECQCSDNFTLLQGVLGRSACWLETNQISGIDPKLKFEKYPVSVAKRDWSSGWNLFSDTILFCWDVESTVGRWKVRREILE